MRVAIIAPTEMPSMRANTIQVTKMAQAFKQMGHDVRMSIPAQSQLKAKQLNNDFIWYEFAAHYGLCVEYDVQWLAANPSLRRYDYAVRALGWSRKWHAQLIYTRLPQCAGLASLFNLPVIFEVHDFPKGIVSSLLFRMFLSGKGKQRLVVITQALASDLSRKFALPNTDNFTIIAPDGVDLERYAKILPPAIARKQLVEKIPNLVERFSIGYSGNLYSGRGIELMIEIARRLPNVNILIIGGREIEVDTLKRELGMRGIPNVHLTGFIDNAEIPLYQASCEILAMPYDQKVAASSGGDIASYLSPMKLFEYMACGRVILSSDLPVLREVLNEDISYLLPIGNVDLWIETIQQLIRDPELRMKLGANAQKEVQKYSWQARVQKIIQGMDTH